jgi:hypothetical protein
MTERNRKMPELHRVGGARGQSARLGRTDSVGSIGGGGEACGGGSVGHAPGSVDVER